MFATHFDYFNHKYVIINMVDNAIVIYSDSVAFYKGAQWFGSGSAVVRLWLVAVYIVDPQ